MSEDKKSRKSKFFLFKFRFEHIKRDFIWPSKVKFNFSGYFPGNSFIMWPLQINFIIIFIVKNCL